MKHTLKIKDRFYNDIEQGLKTFEVRKNDRNFKVGDLIKFVNVNGEDFNNGELRIYEITYILTHEDYEPIPEKYVVFSIKEQKERGL